MSDFSRTRERLTSELEDGLFTRGAQVVVDVGGVRLLDLALGDTGLGEALTSEHLFRVYCTIKPVLAVAIAGLVEAGVLQLDAPLSADLPDVRALEGGVTLLHVLTHTAGLHTLNGITMEMVPPAKRRSMVERARPPVAWRVGRDAGYSEYAGWHVLGWLVEQRTQTPLRDYLRSTVLDPLGLSNTFIGMTPDEYQAARRRIGVNVDMHNLQSLPMLFERTERVCLETNPAHGGYTNACDLALFYRALLDRLAGAGSEVLPAASTLAGFCSTVRAPVFDVVLDRECAYGLGFMTQLEQHTFGDRCSSASFGHSGNAGTSFAFADPEEDLAVAVVINGFVGHEAAFLRRRALVRAIYRDIDELTANVVEPEPATPRGRLWRRQTRT